MTARRTNGRLAGWLVAVVALLMPGAAVGLPAAVAGASTVPVGPYWTITPSPNTSTTQNNTLVSVACPSTTECVAVGDHDAGPVFQTLAETLAGGHWSIVPSADTGPTASNRLQGVSCVSPTRCVAVGDVIAPVNRTLIESYDGTSWSIVPSPDTSPTDSNNLVGVACASATSCVAVGYSFNGTHYQTLIESYDGTSWSIVPSPDVAASDNFFSAVTCAGGTCTAAGSSATAGGPSRTLIESSLGATWSIIPSPDTSPTESNALEAVDCTSASGCLATGYFHGANSVSQTLVERFNSSTWSIIPSADTSPSSNNFLLGVSCLSPTDCTAVGDASPVNGVAQTLIQSFNGSSWSIVASPDTGALQNNSLLGVSCLSAVSCTAVGSYGNGTVAEQTLILSIAVGAPPPAVTGLSPTSGPLAGGTPVTITGTNFTNARQVRFGSVPARSFNVVNDTTITALTPSGIAGATNVTVETPQGTSPATPAERYTATGYWEVAADGGIFAFGANFYGSAGRLHLAQPIVGMARTADGSGYWFAARDGGLFAFGDAKYAGSVPGVGVHVGDIVGMAPDPATGGYWLVSSDGGVFAFDAPYLGSVPGLSIHIGDIVGMAATPDGGGYSMVGADGGVFTFGDARFQGSMGGQHLNQPIVGLAVDPATGGYWEVATDGGVFSFGAPFLGSTGDIVLNRPVVGISANAGGDGYWFVASDGGVFTFGGGVFRGSMGGHPLNKPMVGMAGA